MADLVNKLWGFCHVLRHDGIDYGDYIEQLTFLLFLKMAEEVIRFHHEWYDGSGYPRGLSGSELPVAARELDQAQAVAQRIEPQRLGVDGNRLAERQVGWKIALVKLDRNRNDEPRLNRCGCIVTCRPLAPGLSRVRWCQGEDSNFHSLAATGT